MTKQSRQSHPYSNSTRFEIKYLLYFNSNCLQDMLWFVLFCFVVAALRTGKADKSVSLPYDDGDMASISTERRRFWHIFTDIAIQKIYPVLQDFYSCEDNCWRNHRRHRDKKAREAGMYHIRCEYIEKHKHCFCFGQYCERN